jgi:hypothetical protein
MTAPLPTDPRGLAEALRRLSPCWRDMRAFYARRDDLADAIAALASPSPRQCASCASARHALIAARRDLAAARARASEAERLLASAVKRPRRSRAHTLAAQMALWPENMLDVANHGARP